MNQLLSSIRTFAIEEDGAQIVEYALIIAVISLGLILLMIGAGASTGLDFAAFITKVNLCLSTGTC